MYLVGRIWKTHGAAVIAVQVPDGCVALMPVFKTKTKAKKNAGDKYPIQKVEEIKNDL